MGALPATLMSCADLWFWEICAVVIGFLPAEEDLAAHVTAINFVNVSFMPVFGLAATAATLVGKYIGSGQLQQARRVYRDIVGLNLFGWTLMAIFISIFRAHLAAAYTDDAEVREIMEKLLIIYAFAGFFDSTQNVMGGVLRGLGKQGVAAAVFIFAFYAVMLPLGLALSFPAQLGVYGMWYSFGAGTGLPTLFFALYLRPSVFATAVTDIQEGSTDVPTAGSFLVGHAHATPITGSWLAPASQSFSVTRADTSFTDLLH